MYPKLFPWLPISNYGILALLGLVAGIWLVLKLAEKANIDRDAVYDLALWSILSGLAGAKLTLVLVDLPGYLADPARLWRVIRYAGVFYGGFLAAVAFFLLYTRRKRLDLVRLGDIFLPGVALAHGMGRVGCFLAGCCWGGACDLPWAVTYTNDIAHDTVGTPLHTPVHPVQLYEAGFNFLLCAALVLLWRFQPRRGVVSILYLLSYAAARFGLEFLRADPRGGSGPFSTSQWIALLVISITLIATPFILKSRDPMEEPAEPES